MTFAVVPAVAAPTFCNDQEGWDRIRRERAEWVAKLRDRKFREVEAFFSGMQRAYEAGIKNDAELFAWFGAFSRSDARLGPLLEEWVRQYPESYAAKRALAGHLHAVASAQRGDKSASETTGAQFERMRATFQREADVLTGAERQTRKPISSYSLRIHMAKAGAGPASVLANFEEAERMDPNNWIAKAAFIASSAPKWGGDVATLRKFMARVEASSWPEDLKNALRAEEALVWADAADHAGQVDEAIAQYERSRKLCPAWVNGPAALARLYKQKGDPRGMLDAAEHHIRVDPNSGRGHSQKASALSAMGRLQEAREAYERAAQLGDRGGLEGLAWIYDGGRGVKRDPQRALEYYLQVYDRGGTNVKPEVERLRKELGK